MKEVYILIDESTGDWTLSLTSCRNILYSDGSIAHDDENKYAAELKLFLKDDEDLILSAKECRALAAKLHYFADKFERKNNG